MTRIVLPQKSGKNEDKYENWIKKIVRNENDLFEMTVK